MNKEFAALRDETLLIVGNNTLRLIDFCLQMEINSLTNTDEDFELIVYKLISRVEKDFAKYNKVDPLIMEGYLHRFYPQYYAVAPHTIFRKTIEILKAQRFIRKIIVLHKYKNAADEEFENDYYDGTIEGLEQYIEKTNATALVIDDIDILYQLITRNKISIVNMSFFIAKIGYNFDITKEKPRPKYEDIIIQASIDKHFDFGFFDLWEFDIPTLEFIKKQLKETKHD